MLNNKKVLSILFAIIWLAMAYSLGKTAFIIGIICLILIYREVFIKQKK